MSVSPPCVMYPKFTYEWCSTLWIHYCSHGNGLVMGCNWCQPENNLERPIIIDNSNISSCSSNNNNNNNNQLHVNRNLHKLVVSVFVTAVIKKFIRPLFEKIHKECKGTTSAALHKGRLTENQCLQILHDYPEENLEIPLDQRKHLSADEYKRLQDINYVISCENKVKYLFEKYNIQYDLLLEEEDIAVGYQTDTVVGNNLSFINRILELPDEVGQYVPFVEHTTQFQIIVSRYQKLFPIRHRQVNSRQSTLTLTDLPDPSSLQLSDLAFLLLCLHLQGLVALTPTCNLEGFSNVVRLDTILYLLDTKRDESNRLCREIEELNALLDLLNEER